MSSTKPAARVESSDDEPEEELHMDAEGFIRAETKYEKVSKGEQKARQDRQKLWLKIMQDFPGYRRKHEPELERHVRAYGIPPMFRNQAWQYLADCEKSTSAERLAEPDAYQKFVKTRSTVVTEVQIRKDITRTFPNHVLFRRKTGREVREERKKKEAEKEELENPPHPDSKTQEIVAPYLALVRQMEICTQELDPDSSFDMTALYAALNCKSLAHKTQIKRYIRFLRGLVGDRGTAPISEDTKRIVSSHVSTAEEQGILLEEINLSDTEEVRELYDIVGADTLGKQSHLRAYIRRRRFLVHECAGEDDRESMETFLATDRFGDGQLKLFNVLKAYAVYNPTLGYTQGMGGAAGVFLMYMDEEDSFWMMKTVFKNPKYWHLSQLWIDGFPLLHRFQYIIHRFMKALFPKLHAFFVTSSLENLPATSENAVFMILMTFLPQWFNTMFSRFQPPIVMRMWDLFLLEGPKVLIRVALCMLRTHKKKIKKMPFDVLIQFLSNDIFQEQLDTTRFFQNMHNIKITTANINKYAEQYKKMAIGRAGPVPF